MENPPANLLPATLSKLALCISVIVLHGIYTFWPNAITDLISYSEKTPTTLYKGCEILENIANELEESNIKLAQKLQVKSSLLQFLPNLSIFASQILGAVEFPEEIKKSGLNIINAWISMYNSRMLNYPNIQTILLSFCQDKILWKDTLKCIIKGFEYSEYSKLLENQAFDKIFTTFNESPIKGFLMNLLGILKEIIPKIYNMPEKIKYYKNYGELIFCIGKNFSHLLLNVFFISIFKEKI